MKKGAFFILAGLLFFFAEAQMPQGIKYQAVARNSQGEILANQNINLRLTLVDSVQAGALVFRENHKIGTNQFGLFNVTIGQGINKVADLTNIPWATGDIYMLIEMDATGGNNYAEMGVAELLSVPYAFYAGTAGGPGLNDTSSSNELITNLNFNPATNQLSVTEAGNTRTIIINEEADNLSDNVLNDLLDANALPDTNDILKWDGSQWIASDEMHLMLNNTDLITTNGDTISFAVFMDNTDNQVLSFNAATNMLTLVNGGSVDLSDLSTDSYNDTMFYNPVSNLLTIIDGGGTVIADMTSLVNDTDSDPTNERNLALTFNSLTKRLEISDVGGTLSVDLTDLINDADADPTNEYNTEVKLVGTTLEVIDGGGIKSVNLSALSNDADANPTNELQTLSNNRLGSNVTMNISNGNSTTFNINDADPDPNNELIYEVILDGQELKITDAGGTSTVDLSPLQNDADANPTNEIQTLSFNQNTKVLSLSGSPTSVNLTSLVGTDNQDLSAVVNGNQTVSLNITGGTGTTFSIADNDNDPANESIKNFSFDPTNNILTVAELTDTFNVDLQDLVDDAYNTTFSFNAAANTLTIIDGGGSKTVNLQDLVNDAYNTGLNYNPATNTITITDAGTSYSQNLNDLVTDAYNTGFTIDTASNIITITDGGASLNVNIQEAIADAFNTGVSYDASSNTITVSDQGGSFAVSLQDLVNDAYNTAFSFNAASNVLTISDDGNDFSVNLTDLVNDAYNTGFSFNDANNTITITDNGNSFSVDLDDLIDEAYNTDFDFNTTTNELTITDGGGSKIVDLQNLVDDAYNTGLNFDPLTNTLNITDGGTSYSVNLNDLVTDAYNTAFTADTAANTISITDNGGTITIDLNEFVADAYNTAVSFDTVSNVLTVTDGGGAKAVNLSKLKNDADSNPTNEIQDLSLTGNTLSLSGDASPVSLAPYLDNTDGQNLSNVKVGNSVTINISGGLGTTFSVADTDSDPANELQSLSVTNDTLRISGVNSPVNLAPYKDNTDAQTLTFNAGTLSIAGGNSVVIPDNVNDADANPSNELNTSANLVGTQLNITDAGGTISVNLSSLTDLDADPTNEIQTLNLAGNSLSISGGNAVNL
ncbi:MAG: hypothetical protein SH857_16465, partial [Chitinophagales bacterium]|nr:hypothetical protein [Chitinophagales bacterium]